MTTTDDSPADARDDDDCPICMGPIQDPLTVDCGGGHRFCRACAERWRTRSRRCAVCRRTVTNVDRPHNSDYLARELARILDDLGLLRVRLERPGRTRSLRRETVRGLALAAQDAQRSLAVHAGQVLSDLGIRPDALRSAANRLEVARLEADIE